MKVTKIKAFPSLKRKKNVAAYARVSSGKDAMLHSLSSQVSYYSMNLYCSFTNTFSGSSGLETAQRLPPLSR